MLTTEIIRGQLGALAAGMKAESLQGFVDHAERWFGDEVGRGFFTWLAGLDGSDPQYREILRLAHSCLAWQTYTLAFPHQKFRVGDLGMSKISPPNTVAVTKWEYVDSRDANLSMLDLSLEYFWKEVEALKPAAFTGSAAYARRNRLFVRSADELGSLLPLAGRNARFFQKIVPHIEDVEDDHLRPAMTPGVFDALKTKWQTPNAPLTYAEEKLLALARKATAYLAVYAAWPYLPLTINEGGISETRSKDGTGEEVAADPNLRTALRQQLYTDGQKRLSKLTAYLDETATATTFVDYYLKYLAAGASRLEPDDFTDKPHVIL